MVPFAGAVWWAGGPGPSLGSEGASSTVSGLTCLSYWGVSEIRRGVPGTREDMKSEFVTRELCEEERSLELSCEEAVLPLPQAQLRLLLPQLPPGVRFRGRQNQGLADWGRHSRSSRICLQLEVGVGGPGALGEDWDASQVTRSGLG